VAKYSKIRVKNKSRYYWVAHKRDKPVLINSYMLVRLNWIKTSISMIIIIIIIIIIIVIIRKY
jgi:hypothetical protein